MKKLNQITSAILFCGASLFMVSCGGNSTETTPDESSIQPIDDYEEGDEPLEGTGLDTDTSGTTTDTTSVQ